MSTGGTGGHPIQGLNYGATAGQQSVDLSDDPDPKGTAAGYTHPNQAHHGGKSLLGTLKEALKPGDAKKHDDARLSSGPGPNNPVASAVSSAVKGDGTATQSHRDAVGFDGGSRTLESSMPGLQRDKQRGGSGSGSGGGGGILGAMKSASHKMSDVPGALKKGGNNDNNHDKGGFSGGTRSGNVMEAASASDVPAFDSQGSVGREFTTEGAIGGAAQRVGGPFSKKGAVGRQFTDEGSVGGSVQDTLGQGDATRKGT